jgi:hypothetical protein
MSPSTTPVSAKPKAPRRQQQPTEHVPTQDQLEQTRQQLHERAARFGERWTAVFDGVTSWMQERYNEPFTSSVFADRKSAAAAFRHLNWQLKQLAEADRVAAEADKRRPLNDRAATLVARYLDDLPKVVGNGWVLKVVTKPGNYSVSDLARAVQMAEEREIETQARVVQRDELELERFELVFDYAEELGHVLYGKARMALAPFPSYPSDQVLEDMQWTMRVVRGKVRQLERDRKFAETGAGAARKGPTNAQVKKRQERSQRDRELRAQMRGKSG